MSRFLPSDYQPPVPDFISSPPPKNEESLQLDVVFVGAGPAALAAAIHSADLAKKGGLPNLQIGVLEKARSLGGHTLSGALVNPVILKRLFPDLPPKKLPLREKVRSERLYFLGKKRALPLPILPGMSHKNCWTASLCEIVRWLGKEAEKRGVSVFTSSPAEKLLMEGERAVGVQTAPSGLNRDGSKGSAYSAGATIFAKAVVLAEGSRGHLTQAYLLKNKISSRFPQTYSLGVKEIHEVKTAPRSVFHTLGRPLPRTVFGGGWLYPLGGNLVSIGLIAGLDFPQAALSVHDKLQELKQHPLFAKVLRGGKRLEWGAKTLPEGGFHALPKKLSGPGLLIVGDGAGFLNTASLKGVHYAMASGLSAAETLVEAFQKDDFSGKAMAAYDKKTLAGFIGRELYRSRNLRQSFRKGLFQGMARAALIAVSKGAWPPDFSPSDLKPDNEIPRREGKGGREGLRVTKAAGGKAVSSLSGSAALSKSEGVYLSGNKTRDNIPSHLKAIGGGAAADMPAEALSFYESLCPAGVYKKRGGRLAIQAPDCIDCKATDVLGPRWSPREGGSGPDYRLM